MSGIDELVAWATPKMPLSEADARGQFLRDVLDGLSGRPKTLPCKYFYDEQGSRLFDEISGLDEYYLTRTELAIMQDFGTEIAAILQPGDVLVELGSGSSVKTRLLLDRARGLSAYVPVDISADHLHATADRLRALYPSLNVAPVAADYTRPFGIPVGDARRVIAYFPGSTIGNFHPAEAVAFLRQIRGLAGDGHGGMIIGVDLRKDVSVLDRAYNDGLGVTACFNMNLLNRINREIGGRFDLNAFAHDARYNAAKGRIEMHLVSRRAQTVSIGDARIAFAEGETIWTESSYKHTLEGFAELACDAGYEVRQVWTDPNHWFSIQWLSAA